MNKTNKNSNLAPLTFDNDGVFTSATTVYCSDESLGIIIPDAATLQVQALGSARRIAEQCQVVENALVGKAR